MNAATVTFLFIGGLGVALLAASLFLGDVLHLGHPDADGPFSVPSVAASSARSGSVVPSRRPSPAAACSR